MCCSFFGQILYGTVMIAAVVLTGVSMFSPGGAPPTPSTANENNNDYCKQWWEDLHGWEKAVIACMCLALIAELVAVAWTVMTICACCCKSFIMHPLPLLATFVAVFLTVAVAVYGANNRDALKGTQWNDVSSTPSVGYSFYLACGALALAVADIIIGSLTITLAKRCL